jgi:TonB family protein
MVKVLLFAVAFLVTQSMNAQGLIVTEAKKQEPFVEVKDFVDKNKKECDSSVAKYARIIRANVNNDGGVIQLFDFNGTLKYDDEYSSLTKEVNNGYSKYYHDNGVLSTSFYYRNDTLHGPFSKFHENGQTQQKGIYINNQLHDTLVSYYENGQLRRLDVYNSDKLLNGKCFSTTGADTTYFPYSVDASFPGGNSGMSKYISQNVVYPTVSIEMNEQGRVYLSFVIEKDGSISNLIVERGISVDLDQEAKRIVNEMPNWLPAEQDGYKVRTRVRLPVNFVLTDGGKKEKKKKKRS